VMNCATGNICLADNSPSLEFKGHQNLGLVLDNQSSIEKAFRPDGTIYHAQDRNRVYAPEVLPVTLRSSTFSKYRAACHAMGK